MTQTPPPPKTPSRPLRHFLWLFVLAVVMPGMLLGLTLTWWSAQQLVEGREQEARRLATAAAETVGNRLQTMFTGIAVLSQLPLGKEQLPEFYRVAKGFSTREGYNVTLADSDGHQFLSTRLPLGTPLPRRGAMDSVRQAIASGRPHVSEVFLGKMAGTYVVSVDAPVSTRDGLRIITLSVDASSLAETLLRTALPQGWLLALIDEQGVFIVRSKDQSQWVGKPTRPELIDAARRSGNGVIHNKSVEGFPILNAFHRVPGADWTVVIGIPLTVLYAPVLGPLGMLASLIVGATVLTALLAFLFYRRLTLATAQLLRLAQDPLRHDKRATVRHSFAEFDAVGQILKTTATQQQQAMAQLSQSEERYHTLFESIDEGFCIIEMIYDEHEEPVDWRFLEVNPAFEKQTGLVDATGKRMRELAPDHEAHWFETYGNVARTGRPIRFVNEAKAIDGRWFDLYAFRVGGPDSRKVAVIFTDITETKRLDQALQLRNTELEKAKAIAEEASLAKSDFLSSMSHELRTPLNAILGFAQLLESGPTPPTPSQKRSIDRILEAGWYLLELINEILDLALIESGKVSVAHEPVPLSDVLLECQGLVEPLAHKRGIGMRFPQLDSPRFINADRIRLKQVLINLLYNAIKYNRPEGSVAVECTLTAADSIRISVRDTGAGLAPQQLAQLFQPFNRLGQEASTEEGTGIGLVVAKRLVELMGGTIGAESTVGVGSVFWIELRLAAAPPPAVRQAGHAPPVQAPTPDGTPRRTVLYVEDNPVNLELVEELLRLRPELRLMPAVDGHLGIEFARAHLPAVILMDIGLPGMSGIEAMKTLRADPSTAHIPIIALSANALPRDIERALEAGFFNYLTKPIKVNEFMAALDLALAYSQKKSTPAVIKA